MILNDFLYSNHLQNLYFSTVPADNDTGINKRYSDLIKQRRQQQQAQQAQKIRIDNTAAAEVEKLVSMLQSIGRKRG